MTEAILEKLNHIETLLLEINTKIDNFLGFEDLGEEERREIDYVRQSVKRGESVPFLDVFKD